MQGIGFLGSLVCATLLPKHATSSRPRSHSPFQSLLEGLQYVWRDPTVFALMLLQAIPAFLIMPYNQLLPIFARDILNAGPEGLGTLMTVMGVGSVLGSVFVVVMPPRRQSVYLFVSLVGLSLLLVAFSLSTSLLLSIGIMALIGVAQSIYLATNNTLVQLTVPDALQGRVMSVYMTTWGLMPLGALPQGVLADWFGAPAVLGAVGLLSALIVVVMVARNPALRRLEEGPHPQPLSLPRDRGGARTWFARGTLWLRRAFSWRKRGLACRSVVPDSGLTRRTSGSNVRNSCFRAGLRIGVAAGRACESLLARLPVKYP